MNTDKAYLFGLIIGGGIWGNAEDVFRIKLPYKQWGSYKQNPERASQITRDIMCFLSPLFKSIYGIIVSFETSLSGDWFVLCEGDLSVLKKDLASYDIKCEGELRKNSSINKIVHKLIDDNLKRRFIAGLADTIGSTNPNHRRFTDEVQILSFELNGFDFSFVCNICHLLYSVNCLPDQILWNHPNFHCTKNSYDDKWRKGFKLRIQLDQYADFGAFAFKTKVESSKENLKRQQYTHDAVPCPEREVRVTPSCVHPAEYDSRLPDNIRGGHFIHNRHVCAVLGCEHAPYSKIKDLFLKAGELIIPFPILCKDKNERIREIIEADPLLANRDYSVLNITVKFLYEKFQTAPNSLLYGDSDYNRGYPITEIMQGIAYVVAKDNELNGLRPKGNYIKLIERHISDDTNLSIKIHKPELLTPLVIVGNNGRGALIGARNPNVYKKLISFSPDNEYKLCVRKITEEDLKDA
ncbi:hypothetical protein [Parabacteroides gordonii]|uniref:hypothetical protein n=1 Tax=Parabacteroides gordonii TaxID=574930 RepID=UPI000EC4A69E|nr:hypothetical protein [Parabacteroides gordonii]RGP17297.1 hypothetical protein DXB27_07515 [Parabacteroides gordonii]